MKKMTREELTRHNIAMLLSQMPIQKAEPEKPKKPVHFTADQILALREFGKLIRKEQE